MIREPKKGIVEGYYTYLILIPVYYENETEPSWRTVYKGTKAECESIFDQYPDRMTATPEENKTARRWKYKEMEFLYSIGKNRKADRIKKQYNF